MSLNTIEKNNNLVKNFATDNSSSGKKSSVANNNTTSSTALALGLSEVVWQRLLQTAIESQLANCKMLKKRKYIPESVAERLSTTLVSIRKEIAASTPKRRKGELYSHEVLLRLLNEKVPGHSQYLMMDNCIADFSNGDLKAITIKEFDKLQHNATKLLEGALDKIEVNLKTIIPVKYHGSIVQATSAAHYFMAYASSLERNIDRIVTSKSVNDFGAYGGFFGAGTSLNTNRDMLARNMGFHQAESNSMYALTNRSYIIDFMHCATQLGQDIARLVGDIMDFTSPEFGYATLGYSDPYAQTSNTQSGRSDQVSLQLIRATIHDIMGKFNSTINIISGVKNSYYAADYMLLSSLVMETSDSLTQCTQILAEILQTLEFDRSRTKEMSMHSYSLANDLVEWLICNASLTPEQAFNTAAKVTEMASSLSKKFSLIDLADLQAVCPGLTEDCYSALIASRSVIAKRSFGGSNPVQIKKSVRQMKRKFKLQDNSVELDEDARDEEE